MKYTIRARVPAIVFAEVEAGSVEEAMRIVETGDIDWTDEEWLDYPNPVSIVDELGHVQNPYEVLE